METLCVEETQASGLVIVGSAGRGDPHGPVPLHARPKGDDQPSTPASDAEGAI